MKNFTIDEYGIIPKDKVFGITYGIRDYYYKFTNNVIGLNEFGISAKKSDILEHFGFTVEKVTQEILRIVGDVNE